MTESKGSDRPLRIAMMIETDGPGGAEVVLAQLSEELRRRGHTVIAIGPDVGPGWLSGRLIDAGFERHTFTHRRPVDLKCLRDMRALLKSLELDVVHSHEFTMAVYGAAACRSIGVPHVLTMHGADRVFEAFRRRAALRWAMARSRATVAVSDHTSRYMAEKLGLSLERVRTVRNGIPPTSGDRSKVRAELRLEEDDLLVLAVGNVRRRKGHMVLLQALANLENRGVSVPWRLAIAGDVEEGVESGRLLEFARKHGVEDRLDVLGLRGDIGDLQAAADVCAMPSYWEGLPLAMLEGMFAENPIVASNVGGIPEAVTHGEEGFLVEPGNVDALSSALAMMLSDDEGRRRMGAAALARAKSEFHIEVMADRYLELYRDPTGKA